MRLRLTALFMLTFMCVAQAQTAKVTAIPEEAPVTEVAETPPVVITPDAAGKKKSKIPKIKEWPNEIKTYFQKTYYDVSHNIIPNEFRKYSDQAYAELFNQIDDLTLFKHEKPNFNVRVQSTRNIYYNHDIFNSWTVIDRLNIGFGKGLASASVTIPNLPVVSINMGASGGVSFLNIRRSDIKQYYLQKKLEDIEKGVSTALTEAEEDEKEEKWYNLDPLRRAQYFEPLKRLLIPLRIPLTVRDLDELSNNEIISFDASGTISVGAGIGFSTPTITNMPNFNAGLSVSTYLRGSYRISVMKEDKQYSRIKVAKIWGGGTGLSLNTSFGEKVIYEGFVVPKLGTYGRTVLNVTPFNFSMGIDYSDLFDICYRYDVTNPDGVRAYELAMTGDFDLSAEMVKSEKGKEKPAVSFVFSRKQKSVSDYRARRVQIGFLYQKSDYTSVSHTQATVTLPDGESHVFRSVSENSKEWKSFLGQYERLRYGFSFYYNQELFQKKTDDSFSLIAEGNIDDNWSSGIELRNYSRMFEQAVGRKAPLFTRLPVYPPPVREGECIKWDNITKKECLLKRLIPQKFPAFYGRSSFYFRLGFNRPMLEKFMAIPEDQMWGLLEKAFGAKEGRWDTWKERLGYHMANLYGTILNVPLYLTNFHFRKGSDLYVAEGFMRRFKKLKKIEDPAKRLRKLARMFSTPLYGYELTKVLRLALPTESIPYTIQGTNNLFPNKMLREESWGISIIDHVSASMRRDMDFENYQSVVTLDDKALIHHVAVKTLIPEPIDPTAPVVKKKKKKNKKPSKKGDEEIYEGYDGDFVFEDEQGNILGEKTLDDVNEPDLDLPVEQQLVKIQVDLNLALKPKLVYIKIVADGKIWMANKRSELIIPGTDLIAGPQSLIFTNEPGGLGWDLLRKLKVGHFYRIDMSLSQDGRIWGPVKSYSFRL